MTSLKLVILIFVFAVQASTIPLPTSDEAESASNIGAELRKREAGEGVVVAAVAAAAAPSADDKDKATPGDADKDGIPDDQDTDDDNDGIPDDQDTDDDGDGIPDVEEVEDKKEAGIVETMEDNDDDDDKDDEIDSELSSAQVEGEQNKLIVILIDGVRFDYIDRDAKRLKAFKRMSELGTHAKYTKPVFPANPVPNWYSIATGKYAGRHGLVNDYIFDSKRRHVFDKDGYSDPEGDQHHEEKERHWWSKAEPIWITAKRQRKRVHVSWWMGCDVVIRKSLPQSCDPYVDLADDDKYDELVSDKLKQVTSNMSRGDVDFAMIYYEAVGEMGRKYGPESRKTKAAMRDVDRVIGELFVDLDQKGLSETVNVMIMSDTGIDDADKVINLENYIDMNDVDKLVGEGAIVMIKAETGKNDHMYNHLMNANVKGLNVYKRQNLPFRYRIKDSDLVLPIVLTADEGYDIEAPKIKNRVVPEVDDDDEGLGLSGYDPDHVTEMRGIFYAVGPDFRAAYESEAIKNVDYYNLMCKILDIRPKDNDGDLDRVAKLLKGYVDKDGDDGDDDDDEAGDDAEAEGRDGSHGITILPSSYGTATAVLLSLLCLAV